jgi:hypothetical protein
VFAVPSAFSEKDLDGETARVALAHLSPECCAYRSKKRVPALVWRHPNNGATLSRCAQPLPGISGKRSSADEKLFQTLREMNTSNSDVLYIIDARPFKAAAGS